MSGKVHFLNRRRKLLIFLTIPILFGCALSEPLTTTDVPAITTIPSPSIQNGTPSPLSFLPPTRVPGAPILSPTPDEPHILPTARSNAVNYVVQPNDTLGLISRKYGVGISSIMKANQLTNPDLLSVGKQLAIPPPSLAKPGPDFKIIPDSELVFGPASVSFNLDAFVKGSKGFLSSYSEDVDGQKMTGAEIVDLVSREYSVNPRLLLALLEYRSGWLHDANPSKKTLDYPLAVLNPADKGLYMQLSWAANNLNRGYYLWKVNAVSTWVLADDTSVPVAATINAGTAGVQYLMGQLFDFSDWMTSVSANGFIKTYMGLFGYPFDFTIDPLLPANLTQPTLQLPFETGKIWSFTGGPHAGWDEGSAWAALDFAPPGKDLGCVQSDEWVVASANGLIVRSGNGAVVQDLDGDGYEQTGWTILYMHIETRDRVPDGKYLHAGDRIGHPSCEGGIATGTHVHLARRYNGEWISADGPLPFVLDGWVSEGTGTEYDGYLRRNDATVEAWDSRRSENQIQR
ncbi:MAG: LysM peptidoglycan-binding domain-containing protein [Anaerolineaceae bacterium]|nr:LysM peptidoglycan-binding domain-containing protein [Anaerolineaceae bacterium]